MAPGTGNPPRVKVEIVIDDVEGALVAEREGADRVELCADLGVGGTTPSIGMIRGVLAAVDSVGVQIMVRPRGGHFVYADHEIGVMEADARAIAEIARSASVRVGIVTGALTPAGDVDTAALGRVIDAAGDVPVTFHKAIDATADALAAFASLVPFVERGLERVLTSGGAATALEGAPTLRAMLAVAGGPAVLAGGGVRPHNIDALLGAVPVGEVHLRAQAPSPRGDGTLVTDPAVVSAAVAAAAARP